MLFTPPAACSAVQRQAQAILDILQRRRRLLEAAPESEQARPHPVHARKIAAAIEAGEPLRMLLPAFPGKSPNRRKTLGEMPDLAEHHALANLDALCREIAAVHAPGARLLLCPDGHCFADLVHIPDPQVARYEAALEAYCRRHYPERFDFYALRQAFPYIHDPDSQREELLILFSDSIERIRSQCRDDPATQAMHQGLTRFLLEDMEGLTRFAGLSRNARQKLARGAAYRVMQRSNAWSRLLEQAFPDCLRLSIHPQFASSPKIGIRLADSDDAWLTPWHAAAIRENGRIRLQKRGEIDESRYALVFADGAPSHFAPIAR
nr:isocyanide synthase family protein [Chromobacterium sp. ASV5]